MNIQDEIAKLAFGMTKTEAQSNGICVDCKLPVRQSALDGAQQEEYRLSGLCPNCFDALEQEVDAACGEVGHDSGDSKRRK